MVTALVVGGTGPTGPAIVNGLLQRGHVVTILHSGRHEVEFDRPVEHIHADAHSAESLADAIGSRTFDIGIGMYGRLRVVAAALAGHVAQFIGVGGVFYDGWVNNQFHTTATGDIAPLVPPPYTSPAVPVDETSPMDADPNNKFARLALASEQLVMDLHAAQRFRATMLRFPKVYGPRAIAPLEWSVVRRVLDGRRQMIVPDGGLVLETKAHVDNASSAVLAVVDHPAEAAGETFNVGDSRPVSTREWIDLLASTLGHEFELVAVPFSVAAPSFPYARDPWKLCHHVLDVSKLQTLLHWRPPVATAHGLAATALHLAAKPLAPNGEDETQLGDPFDYEWEDQHLECFAAYQRQVLAIPGPDFRYRHPYRHPVDQASSGSR